VTVVKIAFPKGTPRTAGGPSEPAFFLPNEINPGNIKIGEMRKEIADLWTLVEPYATGAGFELVELQWGREEGGWVLRVFIDRPWDPDDGPRLPGQAQAGQPGPHELFEAPPIGFDDCERVSRDLSAALDVADRIPHGYRLEVSSPGLERPLRREKDFRRFAGRNVKIRTNDAIASAGGRRNFSGTLRGAAGGVVEVQSDDRIYEVPIDDIAKANLVPDWDAEFRRAGREPAKPGAHDGSRRSAS
jgi:ribosome maturation factor RimP